MQTPNLPELELPESVPGTSPGAHFPETLRVSLFRSPKLGATGASLTPKRRLAGGLFCCPRTVSTTRRGTSVAGGSWHLPRQNLS